MLLAFSGCLHWSIALQRGEDPRSELRRLAATAQVQLPLIAQGTHEAEGKASFRGDPAQPS